LSSAGLIARCCRCASSSIISIARAIIQNSDEEQNQRCGSNLAEHRVEGEQERIRESGIGPPTHSFTPRPGSAASHWQYSGENQVWPGSHRCVSNHSSTRDAMP
jgi:hypothetical protein